MELVIITGILMLIMGFLAGRFSTKQGGADSGGMQFMLDNELLQIEGWVVRLVWFDVMGPDEREAMTRIDRLQARGRTLSPEQIASSQNIWLDAFKRWLKTETGQEWSAKNAPHLLGD